MKQGTFVVFEGIYGSGSLVVRVVDRVRELLRAQDRVVYEIDSPDSGRAQLMGAADLDASWRYGRFEPDFFFELAGRARVCAVTREKVAQGMTVLCKSFTLSSITYATLRGRDWFREDLNVLEARARGLAAGGAVTPDLTVFVDVPPAEAAHDLGPKLEGLFKKEDLARQRQIYLEELSKLPPAKAITVVPGNRSLDEVAAEVFAAIRAVQG